MKYEVIETIERIAAKRPRESQVRALVEEGILSKNLTRRDESMAQFYGDDWVSAVNYQIRLAVDFIDTSMAMGLGIPDVSGDSMLCKAVYNAASAVAGSPSAYDCYQEFERLLMEEADI